MAQFQDSACFKKQLLLSVLVTWQIAILYVAKGPARYPDNVEWGTLLAKYLNSSPFWFWGVWT